MTEETVLTDNTEEVTEVLEETTEQPSEGGGLAEGQEGVAQKVDEVEGAPEEYSNFTYPDGVEPNQEVLSDFTEFAKSKNLTQEDAQKLVDYSNKVLEDMRVAQMEAWQAQIKEWGDAVQADAEIGGKDFKEKLSVAKLPLNLLSAEETEEFTDVLKTTGMGSNPTFIRLLYRIGAKMKEGEVYNSIKNPEQPRNVARSLFPSMPND